MIVAIIDGKEQNIKDGSTIAQIIAPTRAQGDNYAIGALVNNTVQELNYVVCPNDKIELLGYRSSDGNKIYMRGILHMLERAAQTVLGANKIRIEHSLNDALYGYCSKEDALSPFELERIEKLMHDYVEEDMPFIKTTVKRENAIAMLTNRPDAARLLEYAKQDIVDIYTCGSVTDFMIGPMPPSTGYLKIFKLVCEGNGFVILYPRKTGHAADMVYERHPKNSFIFKQSDKWAKILNCQDLADLNHKVVTGEIDEFILINEALHEKVIARFADDIKESGKRIVLISGPSSSGKTTFTQRLVLQLKVLGYKPVKLSMDNYFVDRDKIPAGEDGSIDLENVNIVDIPLFNEHVENLLNGETVHFPEFDFKLGKRTYRSSKTMRLETKGVLLIEGIHALNPLLLSNINDDEKFKIYISAQTQLNLTNMCRVSTTDIRLVRRIVRDNQHRGTSAEATLSMWKSVRAGENKWIFPYEENADVMFNSTLFYEILFLLPIVSKLLADVTQQSPVYAEAQRLLELCGFCLECKNENAIPRTSILREFIGGGCFEQ